MLDINQHFVLSKTIVLRGLGEKFWALDTSSGNQYKLNDVSYFILNSLRAPMSATQIVDAVLEEYEATREQVSIDCSCILQFAIENAIIKEVNI